MRLPPDVPRCRGIKAGVPCPVPDNCDCMRLDREMDAAYRMASADNRITLYVVCILVTALIISMITFWKATAADVVDPVCMTKAQARAKYKTSHLYWHGQQHCWDTRPGKSMAGPFAKPPLAKGDRLPLYKPKTEPDGALVGNTIIAQPTVAYPTLMAGGGTDSTMLEPSAMTRWPLVFDVDQDPPPFKPWQERIAQ